MANAKLIWDAVGEHLYETGVEQCALYVMDEDGAYGEGVAWNGITGITESPSGAEPTALYADNDKYLNLISKEEFGATIEAYTYPDEFEECDGTASVDSALPGMKMGQQSRKTFGLSYITKEGNDTKGVANNEKMHIIYGCTAAPAERAYATINDSPEAITFSWTISTIPVAVSDTDNRKTATLVLDREKLGAKKWAKLLDVLQGSTSGAASLPLPGELATTLKAVTD